MEKNHIDDYEIVDLDELIDKAIVHKKVNFLIVDKILKINNDSVNTFNDFLENKVVDFENKNDDQALEIPIDHFNEDLAVKSKNISDYMEQNPLVDFEKNNLLLIKGNQKINETVLKEKVFDVKNKTKYKKERQKIKLLLFVTGMLIAISLFVLTLFANDIESFVCWVANKITNINQKSANNYVQKISQVFIFIIGFSILTILYFSLKLCFKTFLSKNEDRQIKIELLTLKKQNINFNERLNNFKTNINDIKAKSKMFERIIFIFLKLIYVLLIILVLLHAFKIELTALLASAGIVTLVITMAAQVILIDYFSGFVYFFENYYSVGDIVKINDVTGKIIFANIKRIGIESFTGEQHFILHSQIKHIVNYSKSVNKAFIIVDINYQNDIRKCLNSLQDYLNDIWIQNPLIKKPPTVNGIVQFNGSIVKVEIEALVEKTTQWEVEKWLRLNVIEIFKKNEIKTV